MAMYLITSLKSWLGGLSRKGIVYVDFTFNWSYSAIVWPLIYKITTFTDVILCAKIGFKATTWKQHKLWLANFLTIVQPVKSFLKGNFCTFLLMALKSILVPIIR